MLVSTPPSKAFFGQQVPSAASTTSDSTFRIYVGFESSSLAFY